MTHQADHDLLVFPASDPDSPLKAALAIAEGLRASMATARSLLLMGRRVDLAGLDNMFGQLCARCLDLPREQGRSIRPHLESLRDILDSLTALL